MILNRRQQVLCLRGIYTARSWAIAPKANDAGCMMIVFSTDIMALEIVAIAVQSPRLADSRDGYYRSVWLPPEWRDLNMTDLSLSEAPMVLEV